MACASLEESWQGHPGRVGSESDVVAALGGACRAAASLRRRVRDPCAGAACGAGSCLWLRPQRRDPRVVDVRRKAAVLGAGFIGLNLVRRLIQAGVSVAVLDHNEAPAEFAA